MAFHFTFSIDNLTLKSRLGFHRLAFSIRSLWTPQFLLLCFFQNERLVFFFLKIILKTIWSHDLFLFYFKGENKIRKKKP